jgi:hypothetical protein
VKFLKNPQTLWNQAISAAINATDSTWLVYENSKAYCIQPQVVHSCQICENQQKFCFTVTNNMDSVEFDAETIVTINLNEVQFIAIGGECDTDDNSAAANCNLITIHYAVSSA